MLYPKVNKYRTRISLNGLWKFSISKHQYDASMPLQNYRLIGVPGSYNDLFTEKEIRDHVGYVVYEQDIMIPEALLKEQWNIRIGAAGNRSVIYIDGKQVCSHNGGFLPIDCSLPVRQDTTNYRLTVVLDNRLDYQTLPPGELRDGKQIIHYDFRNYIGIHRDVYLYSRPIKHINDIVIRTEVLDDYALIHYDVTAEEECHVQVLDPLGIIQGTQHGNKGTIQIENPMRWDIGQGNLYELEVTTSSDTYTETFGIRHVEVKNGKFYLNDKEVYFKGFGMHEDHETIGKASISALNIRDFNLLQWIGANSFRTSHYPYAEEMYELADRYGILVINEMPAVGMNFWSERQVFQDGVLDEESKQVYKQQFSELIARDKNHPSVIMYSLANEANTHESGALAFFSDLFAYARERTTLPLMIVEWVGAHANKVAQLADVIGLNRYIGWYTDFSDLDVIEEKLTQSITEYYTKFKKPIILSEFGADTIAGLHKLPSVAFSEEFQVEFIMKYKQVIKPLAFVIGEHIWNFADFDTKQGLNRVDGNKKGVFTRNRQPKMVAHILRENWKH